MYGYSPFEVPKNQLEISGGWEVRAVPAASGRAYMAWHAGDELRFKTRARKISVNMLRHRWSGIVSWAFAGKSGEIDLYNPIEEWSYWVDFDNPNGDEATLSISLTDKKNAKSTAYEVYFLGVQVSEIPAWATRTISLSSSVQFIRGEWGGFVALATDTIIGKTIADSGTWAPQDVKVFQQHIRPGMTCADLGANIGHHSVVFSKLVGADGFVVAVEAQETLATLARANVLINGLSNVKVFHLGLGEEEGQMALNPIDYTSLTNFGALGRDYSFKGRQSPGEVVRMTTLTKLMSFPEVAGRKLDFIKMDVQSSELFILRGGIDIIRDDRPVIFTEVSPKQMMDAGYDYREVYQFLFDLDYEVLHPHDQSLSPSSIKVSEIEHEEWDILAVPRA